MSVSPKTNAVFTFGKFKQLTDNAYNVVEFAWPVRAFECYANKLQQNSLDALALAILEMLNLQFLSNKRIADDLGISEELLKRIINKELLSRSYCEENGKSYIVSKAGKEYLSDLSGNEVSSEKAFGYMFQSVTDGEFLPFFYEGTLPDIWGNDDDLLYIASENQDDWSKLETTELLSRINRAYHRYGYIFHKSTEAEEISPLDTSIFVDADDDIADQDFDFEGSGQTEERATEENEIHQVLKNLKNARIKLLKTQPKEMYIKFRLYSLKDEPDSFFVSSPFEDNDSKWYSEAFSRMRNDANIQIGMDESSFEPVSTYCDKVTQQMFVEIPELKEMNPEEYILRTYPEIARSSLRSQLERSYMKILRQQTMARKGGDNEADIIMNVYRTLELILNNYIKDVDSNKIVGTYFNFIDSGDISSIQEEFGIEDDISAFRNEKKVVSEFDYKRRSLMNNFKKGKMGNSLREKYYFLTFAAYLNKCPKFKKALKEDKSVLYRIDSIMDVRNKYAGHNDGTEVKDIDKKTLEGILDSFKVLSKVLITNFD